jgi:hypothetical protein
VAATSSSQVRVSHCARRRAGGEERHLAERDLARPAGEDHDGQAEDGVDQDRRRLERQVDAEQVGEHEGDEGDGGGEAGAHPAHLGQPGELGGDGAHLVRRLPARLVVDVGAAGAAPAQQQGGEDDDGEDGVERRCLHAEQRQVRPRVPVDAELQHAECDGAEADGRQVREAAEQQRGERPQQEAEAQHAPHGEAEDAGPQEGGGEGEERSHPPHERVEALDGDAEQRGPVGPVGGGADRHADGRAPQEHGEAGHGDHRGDEGDDAVGAEDRAAEGELEVERVLDARGEQRGVEPAREQHGDTGEHLGEPDGGDRQDQPRRGEEAADHGHLDEPAEEEGGRRAGEDGDDVGPPPLGEEQVDEDGRRGTQVPLGEADDPVGPVDQCHPERDQRRHGADEDAPGEDADGEREDDELQGEDGQRRHQRPQPGGGVSNAPGAQQVQHRRPAATDALIRAGSHRACDGPTPRHVSARAPLVRRRPPPRPDG